MDLKDVIELVEHAAQEAGFAFRAGHPETSRVRLADVKIAIDEYFRENPISDSDVTESTSHENPEEHQNQKPEQAPGAALPATQFAQDAAALGSVNAQPEPKPTE